MSGLPILRSRAALFLQRIFNFTKQVADRTEIDSKLTAEKLMHDYYQINCGFYEFMKQTVIFCSKDDTVQIRKFLQYAENLKNLKSTTDGLLLYCLLDYSGSLERIEAEISQMYIDMFSL